jgi:type I restriction enzyme, S subunit
LITTRGTIGRAAILPENAERGILHPCLLRLQPDNSQIDTHFLKTLIQDSDVMKTQLSYLSNATTIEVIYSYTIASVIVPVPPLDEQKAIMIFLTAELAKLDTLTAEAQCAIDLLQERRTALISAAVTGQIDVRC